MSALSGNFDATVVVIKVHSQLERGCIFSGRLDDDRTVRVKFSGSDTQPLIGDAFHVKGLITQYRDRSGKTVVQIDSKYMRRVISPGALIRPWLERLPNIGEERAKRLIAAFGHDLLIVLTDINQVSKVAKVIEPTKPALSAKIAGQLYAAVAVQAGADRIRSVEVEFLIFLESLGIKESRVAGQLWRFMAGFDAVDRLKRNPFVAASLMDWKAADRIGQRLLRAAHEGADLQRHPDRLMGALSNVWRELLSEGDTAATDETVYAMLKLRGVDPEAAIKLADENGALRRIGPLLRVPGAAWLEDQIVNAILSIESGAPSVPLPSGRALDSLVYDAELNTGLTLTNEQHDAVVVLLKLPVAALQGGAGVGKTTVMKVLGTATVCRR
jgi:exodeoxyribonuclease V alpha subunit